MLKKFGKKAIKLFLCLFIASASLVSISAASGRKLITKTVSETMNWSIYTFNYSFSSSAVLTYSNDAITQISDLSLYNIQCVCTIGNQYASCTIIPRQKSKTYSGSTATYVVTVTRTAMGSYTDKVDYTIKYKVSDSGTPYSFGNEEVYELIDGVFVSVEVSEPYDIVYLE